MNDIEKYKAGNMTCEEQAAFFKGLSDEEQDVLVESLTLEIRNGYMMKAFAGMLEATRNVVEVLKNAKVTEDDLEESVQQVK